MPSVRVPAVVARGAGVLASASLYIYLVHWQIYPAYEFSLPWLATGPTRWRRLRHATVRAVGWPLLTAAYLLDGLLYQVVRRTRGGNAYQVLARKDG